jgi:hypothetical protein
MGAGKGRILGIRGTLMIFIGYYMLDIVRDRVPYIVLFKKKYLGL